MEFLKTPALILVLLCVCLSGCGDSISGRIEDATKHNIRKVALMYKVFSQAHQFTGPKDEAEFKAWIQGDEKIKERLGKFGVNADDFDSYMTSDRTGDKFEIIWGIKSRPMAPPYPCAYEPNALDGMRQVAMAGGKTRDVTDDDEFEQLIAGKFEQDESEIQR